MQGTLVSILMPVYNTPADVLEEAIESVLQQTLPNWELCICDDCSTSESTAEVLEKFRGVDARIKITKTPRNMHIAKATNMAAEFATGPFVGFLDHDDTLEPNAIEAIAQAIANHPETDVLYTDEDKIEPNGSLSESYFKPGWSPEHLQSVMYVLHFLIVRKSLYLKLGGVRDEYTGAQDYDLALRATDLARKVVHIPQILYHWRKIPGSAAAEVNAKPTALINAKRAINDFLKSKDSGAEAVDGLFPGSFRAKWTVDPSQPVTLLMLTNSSRREVEGKGNILLVEHAVNSIIERSTFPNYRIIVVDNGNMPKEVQKRFKSQGIKIDFYHFQGQFNYPKKINYAMKLVNTEDVIVLNDDLEVIAPDWIEALLSFSRQPEIGGVGAMLLFPNGRIQHAGVALGVNGISTHVFHNQLADQVAYCGYSHLTRNYSAVTGAVFATRKSLFKKMGGYDVSMGTDYNDIDFCLRLRAEGYRIVYTPHARLYHFEGSTLTRHEPNPVDQANFMKRWGASVANDPYFNARTPR